MILIYDNQIAGTSDNADNLPAGMIAIEYDGDLPIESLYFDGEKIQVRPDRPSDRHYWAGLEWRENPIAEPPIFEDWQGLVGDLRGSGIFAKIYTAAKKTNKASTAWTLLLSALTSPILIAEDLAFAIADFREQAPDVLDADDCQTILTLLGDRGFSNEALLKSLE